MAASASVSNPSNMDNTCSSYFQKTVSLCDWWLIKADEDFQGKRLAVAGVTSREQRAVRVFHSAPITKRHDIFTLETADGIVVIFQGFINRTRTIENGFPSEVFSHFLFGFPPYWEEYADNCFKQAVNSDVNSQNTLDVDEPITDQGSEDVRPTPCKNKDTSDNECYIKVCSHDASKKFIVDASKDSDLDKDAIELMSSVKNISTYSGVLNDKLIAKLSISQNESHPSIFVCPRDNDDNVDNMEHDAAKNLPPSTSCLTNVVDSVNDNIAVEARLLSYHSIGSSGMIYDSRSGKRSQKMCTRKSKNKESVSLESNTIKENASEECSVSNSAYMDNLIVSEFDNTETAGAEGLVLTLCPKSLKKENQNKGKNGGMKSGSKNFSTGSMPRDLEAVLGCIGEGEVICEESLLRSTTAVNSDILKQPSNNFQLTVCSTVQTVAKVNEDAPSLIESSPVNAIPRDSGSRKCSMPLGYLKDNKKQKPISGCSVNHKSKELISEVDEHLDGSKLKKRSHSTFQAEKELSQKMLSAARILRNLSGTVGSKEKSEQVSVNKGGSSMKEARRKIIFDTQATPLTGESKEKTCFFSPESLSLKRSRAGRLLLPTLEFWRNQIPVYDADRNITGIQEEFRASRGCKSEPQMRSSKRKGKSPKRH